jgi:hypothetical protein
MGKPLIYVSIKCEVSQIFDSKYKTAVYEAMKKTIGEVMKKNSSLFTMDKSQAKNPEQAELTIKVSVTKDDKSKPPALVANVDIKGMKFSSGVSKTLAAKGGARFEGPNPNKLDKDAAQVTSDAVEALMTSKVVPAIK